MFHILSLLFSLAVVMKSCICMLPLMARKSLKRKTKWGFDESVHLGTIRSQNKGV